VLTRVAAPLSRAHVGDGLSGYSGGTAQAFDLLPVAGQPLSGLRQLPSHEGHPDDWKAV